MSPTCRNCGDPFESDRKYYRYCWTCYWELRDSGRFDDSSARREHAPRRELSRPPVQLDVRLLRDAISRTHPDRHPTERAKAANAVTAALLELLQNERSNHV